MQASELHFTRPPDTCRASMHQFRAIHLCTGERRDDLRVRDWLTRHGVDFVSFSDPYSAAVHVLRNASRVPRLAFIGIDALDLAELQVLDFIHETWPGLVQVAYGADTPSIGPSIGAVRMCSSRSLEALLQASPEELVRQSAGERRSLDDGEPLDSISAAAAPTEDVANAIKPELERPAAQPANGGALADVITPDELSVLLGDDE